MQESVDIASYVDHAIETRRQSQQAGSTLHIEQLSIFGIFKEPLMALRYRLSDGKVCSADESPI